MAWYNFKIRSNFKTFMDKQIKSKQQENLADWNKAKKRNFDLFTIVVFSDNIRCDFSN